MGRGDVFCTMECKNCGKEIPEDSTFCPNCGRPINNTNRNYKKNQLKNLSIPKKHFSNHRYWHLDVGPSKFGNNTCNTRCSCRVW